MVGSSRTAYVARRGGVATGTVADPDASSRARRMGAVCPDRWRKTWSRSPARAPRVVTERVVPVPPTSAVSVSAGTIATRHGRLATPWPACQRNVALRVITGVVAVARPAASDVDRTTGRQCRCPRTWSVTG